MMRVGGGASPELARARFDFVPYTRGRVIEVGVGPYKGFPHFLGVREAADVMEAPVTADFVIDSFENLPEKIEGEVDAAVVWGLGARTEAIALVAAGIVKVGGHVIVVESKDDFISLKVIRKTDTGFVTVVPFGRVEHDTRQHVLVIRYGAVGDMMQTAALLPHLKRLGYHVTLNSHPNGEELLRHDPHVDAFMVQDQNQVPNGELLAYWAQIGQRFDRVVNLSESVEGVWLAHPDRVQWRWPHELRHKHLNVNYLEFMHDVAQLPYHPECQFYPSDDEAAKIAAFRAAVVDRVNKDLVFGERARRPYLVTIALAGSSVHKFNPHIDSVIAQMLLEIPNVHICLVGDEFCKILEAGWENEPRVSCFSGVLGIREALTLAQASDLVMGPETGVLNAVAFESMSKVVMLSHSSNENLTRDWANTEAIAGVAPCYPCHQLHYNHAGCPQDAETGAAVCQANMSPASIWEAVQRAYVGWGTVRRLLEAA